MGKRQVHVIAVRKRTTAMLLVLLSAAMAALLYYLSGKAYATDSDSLRELVLRTMQRRLPVTRGAVLSTLMPVIADILFFVPWGFLMFLLLDSPSRPRRNTYAITILSGTVFALAMAIWQAFLPTRVTSVID